MDVRFCWVFWFRYFDNFWPWSVSVTGRIVQTFSVLHGLVCRLTNRNICTRELKQDPFMFCQWRFFSKGKVSVRFIRKGSTFSFLYKFWKLKFFFEFSVLHKYKFLLLLKGVTFLINLKLQIPKSVFLAWIRLVLAKIAVFPRYSRFLSHWIVKTANIEGCLYVFSYICYGWTGGPESPGTGE